LPALRTDCQRIIAARILNSWPLPSGSDWRTWNWSRARGRRVVQERVEVLREIVSSQSAGGEGAGASPPSQPER
jgi:hypothetical protein